MIASADAWLTVREVAQRAKVTDRTVRAWIRDGRLPANRIDNGTFRVASENLERLLNPETNEQQTEAQ